MYVSGSLSVIQRHVIVYCVVVVVVTVCSLLAQVSGNITAFEALEVKETLRQPLGGLRVGSAAVGQSVSAAMLQTIQAAQITLL